ncbi:hypothetical protein OAK92_01040 [Crocinitomicaceae bacterium]|nr:hypothetical protein [Crocinitomicaceae bacterium]
MKFLIQFPTYCRAETFLRVLNKYVETVSPHHELFFNINCDVGDLTMTNAYVQERISFILGKMPNVSGVVNYDEDTNKISAINDHIEGRDFDIVVCASDDMVPKAWGWDNEIAIAMNQHFPDLDGCVHFNDGNTDGELITFSILGKRLYERFGYIYHPDYKSLYCDNEFTEEVRKSNSEKYIDKIIISHEHWSIEGTENTGEVDLAVQKTLHYSGRDQQVFAKRKELGFPTERITND